MSDAQRDPHVLVSARIGSSQKILSLPSHRARWGWVVTLGAAKLQHPPGRFASMAQLRAVVFEFRDCVPAWLDAKLLHAAENLCPRCVKQLPALGDGDGQLHPTEIVVHDWKDHQERVSRMTEWRRDHGVSSGHQTLADVVGETTGETPGNNGDTSGIPRGLTGAPVRAMQSQSQSVEPSSQEGVQGEEPDAANSLFHRFGRFPSEKTVEWLNDLAEAHSEKRLIAAIDSTPLASRNVKDYLVAIRDQLRAQDHAAEKAERSDELRRNAAKRAPVKSHEEREAEYRALKRAEAEMVGGLS